MSLYYRVELTAPVMLPLTYTPESNVVESIDLELHRAEKQISSLSVRLYDPRVGGQQWPIFNTLPDPAFVSIRIKLYLAKAGNSQAGARLVFDGEVGSLQPGYPGVSHTTIDAHDHTVKARRQLSYTTFRNLSSVQVAQQLAARYGFTCDLSALANVKFTQRAVEIGAPGIGRGFSDWDFVRRVLKGDGLQCHAVGTTLKIYQDVTRVYSTTYTPDDSTVISFDAQINQVHVPGHGGQSKTPTPGGNKGSVLSTTDAIAQEAVIEGSTNVTHRSPVRGADSGTQGAHTESVGNRRSVDAIARRKKNTATLVIPTDPNLALDQLIPLSGWGTKIDGNWYVEAITHSIAGGAGTSTLSLVTPPNKKTKAKAGITQPGGTAT